MDVAKSPVYAPALIPALRNILAALSLYRTDYMTHTRDVLRDLYQGLVPGKLRQSLGEFYTPDWLVDYTVEKVRNGSWLSKRFLDPTCGSGAFLVAIIRQIHDEASAAGWDATSIVRHLCSSVWGFDLSPLAVQTARVNFLMEIAGLLKQTPGLSLEIPVLLADAIYSPAPDPATGKEVVAYQRRFDIIVGNPPWVRWSKLPDSYRDRVKPTCEQYGIFSKNKRHGGNELDISAMITYTTSDKWLKDRGRLAFVITGTIFKNPSSAGFRQFCLNPENPESMHLVPVSVDDMKGIKPFNDASNHTTVAVFDKSDKPGIYPIPYTLWTNAAGYPKAIPVSIPLNTVLKRIVITTMEAAPVDGEGSPWSVLRKGRCGLLNAPTICEWIESHNVSIQTGDIFKHMKVPNYDSKNRKHTALADLVEKAHKEHDTVKRHIIVDQIRTNADMVISSWIPQSAS